jgi:hypothetical protein
VCDELLTGGRMTAGIVRRGDRLLRPMGPWSKLDVAERVRTWPVGPAGAAAALEFTAGELRWLEAVTPQLSEAL